MSRLRVLQTEVRETDKTFQIFCLEIFREFFYGPQLQSSKKLTRACLSLIARETILLQCLHKLIVFEVYERRNI